MRLHALHHEHPAALIGTPTWLSAGLFFGLWIALGREVPVPIADGLVAGLMAGYLFYAVVHDAVHHRRARSGSWLHRAKRRHAQHHRAGPAAEFGVSTPLWDSVFGTRSRCLPRQGTALPTEA
jgi:sterol desaturase/sphingolipid hydroxylase (fatty acid hydroxylase superfamily)